MIYYLLIINVLAFFTVAWDKISAKMNRRRIPEKVFFLLGLIGGAAGVYLGMLLFRHKTRHLKFTIGIPVLMVVNIVSIYFICRYL